MKFLLATILILSAFVGLICLVSQADENDDRCMYELWQRSFPERRIEYQDWKTLKNRRLL